MQSFSLKKKKTITFGKSKGKLHRRSALELDFKEKKADRRNALWAGEWEQKHDAETDSLGPSSSDPIQSYQPLPLPTGLSPPPH